MDKQLIERIALEERNALEHETKRDITAADLDIQAIVTRSLARIDAERGKEAIATKLATDNPFSCFKVSLEDSERLAALPAGTKLFLSPTIPEDMALVPVVPNAAYLQAIRDAIAYAKRISVDEAGIVHQALLAAAQGERNAD